MSLFNVAVLISGSGSNLQAVIDAVENDTIPNAKVALVISSRENVFGLKRAEKHGITNMVIDRLNTEKLMDTLKIHSIDGIILAGYLTVLTPDVIAAYNGRIINIHPALLPLFGGKGFYGIKVHQAVLASGVKYTGATAHIVDCGVDTGAMLVRGVIPVLPDDTPESLQKRVLEVEHKVLVKAVKALVEGRIEELIKNPLTLIDEDYKAAYSIDNPRLCGATPFVSEGGKERLTMPPSRTKGVPPAGGGGCLTAKRMVNYMKILIVGSGGREHAIGWKLKQNPDVQLYFAPGNGGTAQIGENININVDEITKLADFAETQNIDMTIVGPELPLTLGVADEFNRRGQRVFGPGIEGAKLEGSKAFAKKFMGRYDIPTAKYDTVSCFTDGMNLLVHHDYPVVIKADGLAAGKGVIICTNKWEAEAALKDMLEENIFGEAGSTIVIEEFLTGKEVSLLCFTDGETIIPMETASDYKRALDKDRGANTGGMGSISPSPYYTQGLGDEIARKTLDGIKQEGFDYRGVIYIGLILTSDGPKVLEYNVRFGDPETEALLPRLESDLAGIFIATIDKRLSDCKLQWNDKKAVSVIMTSKGYPAAYQTCYEIDIPETKSTVFHAGTTIENGKVITSGGRVLAVTALGTDFEEARKTVYEDIERIVFEGKTYRTDIGLL